MNWISPISSNSSFARIAFSTRTGGVSVGDFGESHGATHGLNLATHVGDDVKNVEQNRKLVRELLDLPPVVYMEQVHGNSVAIVDESNLVGTPEADALVTTSRRLALAVLTADCVPMMLHDSAVGVIAAVHVGRRGLANGVVENTVSAMRSLGAIDIQAELGPAICGDCYEVPLEMQREVSVAAPPASSITDLGTSGLDIRDGISWQLERFGIFSRIDPICTRRSELHYSYRREGRTGRTAGFIYLP
ncbi:MAG TPA: peptidoglycan editing factor PgeF [Candidatus Nanopelagicaceae bacterium]|nr:peptidoglycan editing factor PgeF [Candidatus Nanopelagicaceae bacterium]